MTASDAPQRSAVRYARCPACGGAGYVDTDSGTGEFEAVACARCCSFGWIDTTTGTPADVEPPLFTLTEEGVIHDHAHP